MTFKQTSNFLDWFKDLILKLEDWFHQLQAFFEDRESWSGRVVMSAVDAMAEEEEKA